MPMALTYVTASIQANSRGGNRYRSPWALTRPNEARRGSTVTRRPNLSPPPAAGYITRVRPISAADSGRRRHVPTEALAGRCSVRSGAGLPRLCARGEWRGDARGGREGDPRRGQLPQARTARRWVV